MGLRFGVFLLVFPLWMSCVLTASPVFKVSWSTVLQLNEELTPQLLVLKRKFASKILTAQGKTPFSFYWNFEFANYLSAKKLAITRGIARMPDYWDEMNPETLEALALLFDGKIQTHTDKGGKINLGTLFNEVLFTYPYDNAEQYQRILADERIALEIMLLKEFQSLSPSSSLENHLQVCEKRKARSGQVLEDLAIVLKPCYAFLRNPDVAAGAPLVPDTQW